LEFEMAAFSPSDAALEGFRLTRDRPGSVLAWAAIFAITIIIAAMLIVTGFAPRISGSMGTLNTEDSAAMMRALLNLAPALLALLAVWVGLSGVIGAAIYREVLNPTDSRMAYLRLNKDEGRQVGALFTLLFAAMVFSTGVNLLLILPLRLLLALAGKGPTAFIGDTVVLALNVWFGVRLSLLPAMTFATHKIDVVAAWRLTSGQFWRVFGTLLLSFIFATMVYFLILIVAVAMSVLVAGGDMGVLAHLQNPQVGMPAQAYAAVSLYAIITLLIPVLAMVIIQAPTAVAYRALASGPDAGAADI